MERNIRNSRVSDTNGISNSAKPCYTEKGNPIQCTTFTFSCKWNEPKRNRERECERPKWHYMYLNIDQFCERGQRFHGKFRIRYGRTLQTNETTKFGKENSECGCLYSFCVCSYSITNHLIVPFPHSLQGSDTPNKAMLSYSKPHETSHPFTF